MYVLSFVPCVIGCTVLQYQDFLGENLDGKLDDCFVVLCCDMDGYVSILRKGDGLIAVQEILKWDGNAVAEMEILTNSPYTEDQIEVVTNIISGCEVKGNVQDIVFSTLLKSVTKF